MYFEFEMIVARLILKLEKCNGYQNLQNANSGFCVFYDFLLSIFFLKLRPTQEKYRVFDDNSKTIQVEAKSDKIHKIWNIFVKNLVSITFF